MGSSVAEPYLSMFSATNRDDEQGSGNICGTKLLAELAFQCSWELDAVQSTVKPIERTPTSANSSKVVNALSGVNLIEC